MTSLLYPRLAVTGIMKNRRTYLPYILYEIHPGTTVVETYVTAEWPEP